MRSLSVFNNISVDGFFSDEKGGLAWAYEGSNDPEFKSFVETNANQEGILLFGRKTYELMKAYWPTKNVQEEDKKIAQGMNQITKIVFSKTLSQVDWDQTLLLESDPVETIKKLKSEEGPSLVVLGSGSLVSQFSQAGLVDQYMFVINPVVLAKGRSMFEGLTQSKGLKLISARSFKNGKLFVTYRRAEGL